MRGFVQDTETKNQFLREFYQSYLILCSGFFNHFFTEIILHLQLPLLNIKSFFLFCYLPIVNQILIHLNPSLTEMQLEFVGKCL